MGEDLEGKYFAFVFRSDYFGMPKFKTPLAIYQIQKGELEEIRHPADNREEYNYFLFDFLKKNKITTLYTLDKKVRKFKDLEMDFFVKEKEVNYPDRQSITWFRYWPLNKKDKNFKNLFEELGEKNIEVKYISP